MIKSKGTPQTLLLAIKNGLEDPEATDLDHQVDRVYDHVRDFIAQKFGPRFITSEGETLDMLDELFKDVTKE